jgi:hypothetical protein
MDLFYKTKEILTLFLELMYFLTFQFYLSLPKDCPFVLRATQLFFIKFDKRRYYNLTKLLHSRPPKRIKKIALKIDIIGIHLKIPKAHFGTMVL